MIHDDTPAGKPAGPHDPFGRISSSDGSQERLKAIADLANISGTVGAEADNDPDNVARIEMLLDGTGDMDLKPSDGPTGHFGQRLLEAISTFQKRNNLPPTGFIRPGDATHRALVKQSTDRSGQNARNSVIPDAGQPTRKSITPGGPSTF